MNTEIITRVLGEAKLWTISNSPKILLIGGIVAGIGAVVTSVISTTKVIPVVEDTMVKIDELKNESELEEESDDESGETVKKIVDVDNKKEINSIRIRTFGNLIKIYAPTIILMTASIGCILASNHILVGRNITLASAYAGLADTFNNYRDRVKDKYGEEAEENIYYNRDLITSEEIIEDADTEGPSTEVVKKTTETKNSGKGSSNMFWFGACTASGKKNQYYTGDYNVDITFLRGQMMHANDRLRAHYYLWENTVLDWLGLDTCSEGQTFGWRYSPDEKTCSCHVDFGGIDNIDPITYKENGGCWITLNTDGYILDKVYKKGC